MGTNAILWKDIDRMADAVWTGKQSFPGVVLNATSLWTAIEWMTLASLNEGPDELLSARLSEMCSHGFQVESLEPYGDTYKIAVSWSLKLSPSTPENSSK